MKKTLFIIAAIIFTLTACNKSTYVDGTYKASYDALDSHGWAAYVQFTLTADEISNVDFDYLDADGNRKSLDSAYNASMLAIVGTNPAAYCPLIEAAIANATIVPQFDSIDAVAGATHSSENADVLVKAALDAAVTGEPTTISVPQTDVK